MDGERLDQSNQCSCVFFSSLGCFLIVKSLFEVALSFVPWRSLTISFQSGC